MRQIMNYDAEFRREEAASAVLSREALTTGTNDQFDPTPMLDRPGVIGACKR
jgi:hypothetical protein